MKRNESVFTFHKNIFHSDFGSSRLKDKNCRQKLQDKFADESPSKSSIAKSERSVLSVLTLNDTRKVFRNGAERISRTLSSVRTTIGTFSQKFRTATKRRQILEEGPTTPMCMTPQTRSKQVLGRTPTKLYSPFGIETPVYKSNNKENKENIIQNKITKGKLLKKSENISNASTSHFFR